MITLFILVFVLYLLALRGRKGHPLLEQLRQWKRRSRITYDADRDVYIKSCKNINNLTA